MVKQPNAPLVTLCILAYNQQDVVGDAIEGAFAQTYEPLEIILSDDCSHDGTFAIMQDMVAAYDGPHKVIARQTSKNLQLVPHLDDVVNLANGDFFVASAGDDISFPERVALLVAAWQGDEKIMLVHSAAEEITFEGTPTGVIKRPPERVRKAPTGATFIRDRGFVIGATAGWDRRVFDCFGPLGKGLSAEDRVVPFRATLLGDVVYVDMALVGHRQGGISSTTGKPPGWEYLYGVSHKLRKWTAEIDRYVLEHFGNMDYADKLSIETTCSDRSIRLQFMVNLAEVGYGGRIALLPRAFSHAMRDQSIAPLKHWLRYVLDKPYLIYANRRSRNDVTDIPPDPLGRQ